MNDFYGAILVIDGEWYSFDFDDKELKEFKEGKLKKFKNKYIEPHSLDKLALLGISIRKMTKIIENLRDTDASV